MLTRYLVVALSVVWAGAALAQGDRTRPSEGQEVGSERPWEASKVPPPDVGSTRAFPQSSASKWGAVAYTADGAFGAAYGYDSKEEAERLAVDACRRESTDKNDCSRGVIARQDNWFHIQFCQLGSDWSTHITTDVTLSATNQGAADYARRSKYGPQGCRLVPNGLFHSGGLHTK